MIKFYCYSCGKKIGVPLEVEGKRVSCPNCATANIVPAPPKETPPPSPPDEPKVEPQYAPEPPALPSGMDVDVLSQIESSGKRLTGSALRKFLREKRAGKNKE